MPDKLKKIIKLTQAQYDILEAGGTAGGYTGLDPNYIYFVEDTNEYITTLGGQKINNSLQIGDIIIAGNTFALEYDSTNHYTAEIVYFEYINHGDDGVETELILPGHLRIYGDNDDSNPEKPTDETGFDDLDTVYWNTGITLFGDETYHLSFPAKSGVFVVDSDLDDYQPKDADLTAIAALSGTSGLLRKTAADTWTLDTNTYLTQHQAIKYIRTNYETSLSPSANESLVGDGRINFHKISKTGSYNDLLDKPTIPVVDYPVTDVKVGNTSVVTNKVAILGTFAGKSILVATDIPALNASKITEGTFSDTFIASASIWNAKYTKPATGIPASDLEESYLLASTAYLASASVSGNTLTITPSSGSAITYTPTFMDTGATSVEVTGSGNAVTTASYDATTRKITLTKGTTFLTSHQAIKKLDTTATTSQTTSSNESIVGPATSTIVLHKISKTGSYNDLLDKPTIPVVDYPVTDVQVNGISILSSKVANLVTNTAYNASTNKIATMSDIPSVPTTYLKSASTSGNTLTLTKQDDTTITFTPQFAHQLIKTLNTDNTAAQTVDSSEAIKGFGTINLHKVAKTGTYSDLIGTPTLGALASKDKISSTDISSGYYLPSQYISQASASGNTLTLTSVGGTTITYTPSFTIPTKDSDLTNDRYVRYDTNTQGLTSTQQANARANIGATNNTGTVTSIALTMPDIFTVSGSPVTRSGTIAVTFNNLSAGRKVFASPSDGTAGAPLFRALVADDIPSLNASKINAGTFADARIASASTWNAKSTVSASTTGTATTEAKYITIDGTEWKLGGGSGTITDVKINNTSIVSSGVANILTKTTYNSSTNKIATENDLTQIIDLR